VDYNQAMQELAGKYRFKIFPCQSNKHPSPGFKWKEGASFVPSDLRHYGNEHHPALAGVKTGEENNIFVIDIDVKDGKDGMEQFQAWLGDRELPKTAMSRTASGGYHLWFKYPKGSELTIGQNIPAKHVDFRGNGVYVVA